MSPLGVTDGSGASVSGKLLSDLRRRWIGIADVGEGEGEDILTGVSGGKGCAW